jgi:hypothetical protein
MLRIGAKHLMDSGHKIFQKVLEFKELSGFYITSQTSHCMKGNTNVPN